MLTIIEVCAWSCEVVLIALLGWGFASGEFFGLRTSRDRRSDRRARGSCDCWSETDTEEPLRERGPWRAGECHGGTTSHREAVADVSPPTPDRGEISFRYPVPVAMCKDVIDLSEAGQRGEKLMTITDEIRQLIDCGPLAHLTTLNADGSPQVSVVWVGIMDDEFVCGHLAEHQKVKNIRRDPRVALSLLGSGKNRIGLQQYLVVYGQARITEGGAVPLLERLARVYLGPEVEFPPAPLRTRAGYVTHIIPRRFAGIGPWSPDQD